MDKIPAHILDQAKKLEAESPDAMIAVFSPGGDYLYASANHEQMIGYTPAELAALKLMEIVAPADLEHTRLGFMDTILHGRSVLISVHLIAKDGKSIPVKAEAWHAADRSSGQGYLLGRAHLVDTTPQ